MATSGELVTTVATVLGIGRGTVLEYYRRLREAGQVSLHGRGLSGARMSAEHAAILLVAIGGVRSEKASADKVVHEYGLVRATKAVEGRHNWELPGMQAQALRELPSNHTIIEALTGLLHCFSEARRFGLMPPRVTIEFSGPTPAAEIKIKYLVKGILCVEIKNYEIISDAEGQLKPFTDLRFTRSFGDQTLNAIAALLANNDCD